MPPQSVAAVQTRTHTQEINAPWQKAQGQKLDAAFTERRRVSIFLRLNDKPNCDPFYTWTGNLRDIHLGGLFIYEQVPENRLLTLGLVACVCERGGGHCSMIDLPGWLCGERFWRINSAPRCPKTDPAQPG